MVTAFAMRNFLKAAVGCLGMIAGCFSTGEAQDFGGMSFGEAGNFGPPQTSGSSKATVISYGEASFVIVTELALPDHWHVYYKNPGTVGLPMEGAFQPVPGFRVEGPFWQIPELGKGLVDFYGYSGKAKMAFRVTPEKDAPPEATFTTTMTWQMCAEQCAAPETRNFSVTLKRGDGQTAPDAAELTGNMAGLAAPDWAEGLKAGFPRKGKPSPCTSGQTDAPFRRIPSIFSAIRGKSTLPLPKPSKNWMTPIMSCPCNSMTPRTAFTPTTCRTRTRGNR